MILSAPWHEVLSFGVLEVPRSTFPSTVDWSKHAIFSCYCLAALLDLSL